MNDFGKALKSARKGQRITLSQLSEVVGKSVGYISDIEQGRKRPPADKSLLANMEAALNTEPGFLRGLAEQVRELPKNIISHSKLKPRLSQILLRAERDLTEVEFEEFVHLLDNFHKRTAAEPLHLDGSAGGPPPLRTW